MAADPTVIEIVVGGNTASVEDSSETIEVYSDSRDANSIRNRLVETGTPADQEVITWSSSASEWIYQSVAENVDDQVATLLQSSSGNGITWTYDDSAGTLTPTLSIRNADVNASAAIAVSKLAASSVNYGGVTLTLGGSDTTPAFNLSDATAYVGDSSLVTTGAVNSGSITSGHGSVDVGSSSVSGGIGTFSSLAITGDATVGDDLSLISDSAVLNFGENSDVSLTHVHDTGLLLNSTMALQFGDSGSYIQQAGDGVLRINGEGTVDIYGSSMVALSNDVRLNSDASVLGFGVDNDVTLTHVHDTGLLLNSTMAIQFNDASQYINAPTATVLDITATDEIELNATTIDINGTLDVSGTATFTQVDITAEGDLRLQDNSGGQYVGLDAPATVSASYTLTMPSAVGSVSQVLSLSNTDGTLAWSTPQVGDITAVTAGDGLSGGGTSGAVSLALDLNELTAATVNVANDSIAIVDASDSNTSRKETIADLMSAVDGSGLTASSGVLSVDASQTQITAVGALGAGSIASGFTSISTSYTDAKVTSVVAGTLVDVSGTTGDVTVNVDLSELATSTSDADGDFFAVVDSSNAQKKLTKGNIDLAGFTGTAASATLASTITVTANNATSETVYPLFVDGATGTQGAESDTGLNYNPSSGVLTTTQVTGNLVGNVTGNVSGTSATVTGASQSNITSVGTLTSLAISGDATVGDDLSLISDAAVLNFGENSDVSLTHVHDTGLLLNSTRQLQFGDSGSYIQQSGDGTLRINGEGVLDLYGSSMIAMSNDVRLNSDASVLGFGVNNDVTLTHVHDTGLLLNSTMALQFNDASQYINAPSNAILDITATDEIELNATTIDINGAVDISGAVQAGSTITVGVDDAGHDVKFFGNTASAYMLWDTSDDDLILGGAAGIVVPDGKLTLASTAVTSTGAELNILDGATVVVGEINYLDLGATAVGNAIASKAVVLDSNKDYTGVRNLTATTFIGALTGNASGSSASCTGNAATATLAADATTLKTPRAINSVNFDGSAPITVTAAAGTLSGGTLASGVTASSLTSVGTLSALTVATGDLNVDSRTLYVDSSENKVSVTTNSIANMLGVLTVTDSTDRPPASSGDVSGHFVLGLDDNYTIAMGVDADPGYTWMQAAAADSAGVFRRLCLNPLGGNVGVNMIAPTVALHVTGDCTITGALSKGSGSFKVDHVLPSMESTHDLYHSFVESSECLLIYRGSIELENGQATIQMDDEIGLTTGTFELLVRDAQVYTTNETSWDRVRGSIDGSALTIECENSDCSDVISWLIVGERMDKHIMETSWTDGEGRPILERLKPTDEDIAEMMA